jgi:hypothetical protein
MYTAEVWAWLEPAPQSMTRRTVGRLGRIDQAVREDERALSRDVPLDLHCVKAARPAFENALDSLRGRRMAGLVYNRERLYRLIHPSPASRHRRSDGHGRDDDAGGTYLRPALDGRPALRLHASASSSKT